jgi:uncharacterized lipoprotein YddW (UPF0748 family)
VSVLGVVACAAAMGCTQILDWPVAAEAARPLALRPAAPRADLVDVAVPRELRGMWVATVSNLDFPSRAGLAAAQQRAELDTLVDTASDLGLNALVFQVRPEADAFYASALEPWSRFLTGRQGGDPGFDPLAYLVEAAHARSLEVHAWFNPYRAATSRKATLADAHLARRAVSTVRAWGSLLWLDPGVPEVRDHTVAVVGDVLDRYDVDGIHLDDYFYPYPERGRTFPDEATYRTYLATGGQLERDAWRRGNVDALIQGLASEVHTRRPDVRFGVSPFGIYRPGSPEGVRGMDQVAALHADPLAWYAHGWVDYLAPQLYWTTTKEPQRFDRLLTWWNDQVVHERPLLVGLDLTKVGSDPAWTLDELRAQVTLSRAADTTAGHLWFRAAPVLADTAHLRSLFRDLYAEPALPPPLARGSTTEVAPPTLRVKGATVTLDSSTDLRAYVLYRSTPEGWQADQILSADTTTLTPGPGTWAVSAVDRRGTESRAVRCELTADS